MGKIISRIRVVGASVIVGGSLGLAGLASADMIGTTGPGSYNAIYSNYNTSYNKQNYNNLHVSNSNYQNARTGTATVGGNTGYGGNNFRKPMCYTMSYTSYWSWYQNHPKCQGQFMSYVPAHNNYCRSHGGYGGGNTYGGSAYTGNASNHNNTGVNTYVTNAVAGGYGGSGGYGGNNSVNVTGPGSSNTISSNYSNMVTERNTNNVNVANSNNQTAYSGNATVSGNTVGGSAYSGSANNTNTTALVAQVTNMSSGNGASMGGYGGSNNWIGTTGPGSYNAITTNFRNVVNETNTNNLSLSNVNNQTAVSGNASVVGNTVGGSASTGAASNTNSTYLDVSVNNN